LARPQGVESLPAAAGAERRPEMIAQRHGGSSCGKRAKGRYFPPLILPVFGQRILKASVCSELRVQPALVQGQATHCSIARRASKDVPCWRGGLSSKWSVDLGIANAGAGSFAGFGVSLSY